MKRLVLFIACAGVAACARGQSIGPATINASGGSATAGGLTHEWSVGEMAVVSTYTSASLLVTQGVLQPADRPTGVTTPTSKPLAMKVYPNPVTEGMLYLQPAFTQSGTLSYRLTDAAGKTLLTVTNKLATGNELQSISMSGFAAGHYTLSVQWQDGKLSSVSSYGIEKLR